MITRAPGQTVPEPDKPEPVPVTPAPEKKKYDLPAWVTTEAQPVPVIARRIEAAEPAALGMS
jgi:hypothetical protein